MTANYISRATLLLQYYAALGELAEESRLAASEGVGTLQVAPYTLAQQAAPQAPISL